MKIRKRQLQLFILLFAASSLLFQLPSGAFASSPSEITAADSETDESNGFTMLDGAYGVDTFTIGSSTYAIVVSQTDDGVQIINVTDPANIVELDRIQSSPGMDVIPHNSHFLNDYIITSYYRDGVTIHDVSNKGKNILSLFVYVISLGKATCIICSPSNPVVVFS